MTSVTHGSKQGWPACPRGAGIRRKVHGSCGPGIGSPRSGCCARRTDQRERKLSSAPAVVLQNRSENLFRAWSERLAGLPSGFLHGSNRMLTTYVLTDQPLENKSDRSRRALERVKTPRNFAHFSSFGAFVDAPRGAFGPCARLVGARSTLSHTSERCAKSRGCPTAAIAISLCGPTTCAASVRAAQPEAQPRPQT
jgi:hypothetical protein